MYATIEEWKEATQQNTSPPLYRRHLSRIHFPVGPPAASDLRMAAAIISEVASKNDMTVTELRNGKTRIATTAKREAIWEVFRQVPRMNVKALATLFERTGKSIMYSLQLEESRRGVLLESQAVMKKPPATAEYPIPRSSYRSRKPPSS